MMKAGIPSGPTDFDGFKLLVALRTFEAETVAIGRESDDRNSTGNSRMRWLLKALKVYSKNLCSFTCLDQTVSITIKFNAIFVDFHETRHVYPTMHRICLDIIIDSFNALEIVTLYGYFDKHAI
jgi:hypothetical protein